MSKIGTILAAIYSRIILLFHDPSTSLYRIGGSELEESNTNEIQAKSNVMHLAPNLRLST